MLIARPSPVVFPRKLNDKPAISARGAMQCHNTTLMVTRQGTRGVETATTSSESRDIQVRQGVRVTLPTSAANPDAWNADRRCFEAPAPTFRDTMDIPLSSSRR